MLKVGAADKEGGVQYCVMPMTCLVVCLLSRVTVQSGKPEGY